VVPARGQGSRCLAVAGLRQQPSSRYLADILRHFRDAERIDFTYVSPVNEPQWEWDSTTQEGNRYSNRDIRSVVLALGRELRRASLKTRIAIVESGNIPDMYEADAKISAEYQSKSGSYIDTFLGDPQVSRLLANRIGFHRRGPRGKAVAAATSPYKPRWTSPA
jgi:hypothetical protein